MRTLYLFLIPFVILGCNEITYPVPQPSGEKNLATIPDELHGKFMSPGSGLSEDTVAISRNGIFDPNHPNDAKSIYRLSDSLVLRKYKGYYFMSLSERPSRDDWSLVVIKRLPNGDLETHNMSADDKNFPELLRKVSSVVPIDSTKMDNSVRYHINPSTKQLMQLVHEGYFSDRKVWKHIK
jgi:hypothetical protein